MILFLLLAVFLLLKLKKINQNSNKSIPNNLDLFDVETSPDQVNLSELYTFPYQDNVFLFPLSVNLDKQLSENFILREFVDASFILESEKKYFKYLPIDTRLIQAAQLLRTSLNSSINVNCSFRSRNYELSVDRNGESQHVEGKAMDLSGYGLVNLLDDALKSKNQLYHDLRNIGINTFGFYDTFVHLDTRRKKLTGGYYTWDFRQ